MEADAIFDFSATQEDELGFKNGSFLKLICVEDDPNWFMAEQNGRTGLVPCNYIKPRPHDWYVRNCRRLDAETLLLEKDPVTGKHLQPDGAFLLRQSGVDGNGFSLSVKEGSDVLHFKVLQDDTGKYFIWLAKFDSINQLIDYHRETTISRTHTLLLVDRVQTKLHPPPGPESDAKRVIARFDFVGSEADILSFNRGDVIEVIEQESENWWRGRLPNGRTGLFPYNYVDILPSII